MGTTYDILIEARERASTEFDKVHNAALALRAKQERADDAAFRDFISRERRATAVAEQESAERLAIFKKRMAAERAEAARNSGIGGLKRLFGEESALGSVGKIAMGTGAVAGITLMLNALKNVTGEAVRLKNEFEAGRMSAGQVADELTRSIPILGQIYTAGRNIRELATGEKAEVAAIIAQADAMDRLYAIRQRAMEAGRRDAEQMAKTLTDLKRESALIGADQFQADVAQAGWAMQDRAKAIRDEAAAVQKRAFDNARQEVDDGKGGKKLVSAAESSDRLRGQIDQLEGELRDAQAAARRAEENFAMGGDGDGGYADRRGKEIEERLATLKQQHSQAKAILADAQAKADAAGAMAQRQLAQLAIILGKNAVEGGKEIATKFWEGMKQEATRAAAKAKAEADSWENLDLGPLGRADFQDRVQEEKRGAQGRQLDKRDRGLARRQRDLVDRERLLERQRGTPIFQLEESRRLTGVQGAKVADEELTLVRKQLEEIEKERRAVEDMRDELRDLATAARENKLLVADLRR